MNVLLIGIRGSGKSTVGKALADRLGCEFIDCDLWIEKQTGLSIAEIFERHGETHFRTLESQALAELAKLDGKVIATGGGAPLKYQNMQTFKRHDSRIFFLEVGPETAFRRIKEDASTRARRPPLTDKDPLAEIKEQIEFRRPYYLKSADRTIPAEGKSVEEIVKEILGHLGTDPGGDRRETDPVPI